MCDPLSLASAGSDILGGVVGARDAKSRASFEAAQIDALRVMTAARGNSQAGELMIEMGDMARSNLGAMAATGLAAASFAAIADDATDQRLVAGKRIAMNTQAEIADLTTQAVERRLAGRSEARSSLFSGFSSAAQTIYTADRAYGQARTPQRDADGHIRRDDEGNVLVQSRAGAIGAAMPGLSRVGSFFRRR